MAVKFSKKLENEISKTVRNFNNKISRLEKLNHELLPEKISKKALKQNYDNRNELRRKLKELQRFSKRGSEQIITTKGGVKITQYELNNLRAETIRIKQNLTREINRLKVEKPTVLGKTQDITFAQMGDQYFMTLLGRKDALDKNLLELQKEDFERYQNLVSKLGKNEGYMNYVFKNNYLKMLTDLGYYYDYDNDKLNLLKEKLIDLDKSDFLKLFRTEKSVQAILYYYPAVTRNVGINPSDIKDDVVSLYDNLINNIDEILKPYA